MSLKSQVSQEDAEPIYLVILVKNMHTVFLLFVDLNDCESQVKWRKNIFTSFLILDRKIANCMDIILLVIGKRILRE